MKVTLASVKEYVKNKSLTPIELDGVVDGFAYKEEDITIGEKLHRGRIIKFKPLADWGDKDAITYE